MSQLSKFEIRHYTPENEDAESFQYITIRELMDKMTRKEFKKFAKLAKDTKQPTIQGEASVFLANVKEFYEDHWQKGK